MPTGSFHARAVIAKVLFSDTFTRTHASSWGTDWQFTSSSGTVSVDGAVGRLTANGYAYTENTAGQLPWTNVEAGYIQFDLYVPADLTDNDPFTYVLQGGPQEFYAEAGWTTSNQYYVGIYSFGVGSQDAEFRFNPTASTWYRFRWTWSGYPEGPTGVKAWKVSDPEPQVFNDTGSHSTNADWTPAAWFDVQWELDAPFAEQAGYDNFILASFGAPADPATRRTFTANAVKRQFSLSGSLTADAVIAPLHFTADAWLMGGRLQHHRQADHYGSIQDTSVVIASPIGQYPAGTDVHTILVSLYARIAALQNNTLKTRSFTADAWLGYNFKANAVLTRLITDTIPADALIVNRTTVGLPADAFITAARSVTFSANAYLITSANGTWTWYYPSPNPADGTTTVFVIPPYKQGTVQAYINGVPQTPGVDYTETDDTIGTITFTNPPPLGSIVSVHFIACGG